MSAAGEQVGRWAGEQVGEDLTGFAKISDYAS